MSEVASELIRDRLKKIECLARSGVEGEQQNAQRLLEQLCRKHGVTIEELADDEKTMHRFAIRDAVEKQILTQVVVYVCRTQKIRNVSDKGCCWFELTAAQAIDVAECYAHYKAAWKEQLKDVLFAFIHKNGLFGPKHESAAEEPITDDAMQRARRIVGLMQGMESKRWRGQRLLG